MIRFYVVSFWSARNITTEDSFDTIDEANECARRWREHGYQTLVEAREPDEAVS